MQTSNTFVSTRETDLAPAVNCHNHVLGGFVLFPRPREDILAGICWCNPHHSSLRMRERDVALRENGGMRCRNSQSFKFIKFMKGVPRASSNSSKDSTGRGRPARQTKPTRTERSASMLTCAVCANDRCTYGPNRQGRRTDCCCCCAIASGWSARHLACAPCAETDVKARIALNPPSETALVTFQKMPSPKGTFIHAVRDLRRIRASQAQARTLSSVTFKDKFDLLRTKRRSRPAANQEAGTNCKHPVSCDETRRIISAQVTPVLSAISSAHVNSVAEPPLGASLSI